MYKAIQQVQLRTLLKNEETAKKALSFCKEKGIEGIELNTFMLHRLPWTIRIFTKLMGMAMGEGANLDWHKLIKENNLKVISLHCDLGSLEKNLEKIADEAKSFDTNKIVLTGMYQYDYSDINEVNKLIDRLNNVGKLLKEKDIEFLYHNHNCEFIKLENGLTAYEHIVNNTNPLYVNFEVDVYWMAEAGVDVIYWLNKLGNRVRLSHFNDRGNKKKGKRASIVKAEPMELGTGNMNLNEYVEVLKKNDCEAIILEMQNNWINNDPIESISISSKWLSSI